MPLANPGGSLFGAQYTVETMHAFCNGIIEIVTFLVLDNVPPSKKAALDADWPSHLIVYTNKSTRRCFPPMDFSNGITNLTKILSC
jgi:predicted ThiF/HesA family dinucleotide-utilizing enzyme